MEKTEDLVTKYKRLRKAYIDRYEYGQKLERYLISVLGILSGENKDPDCIKTLIEKINTVI